MGGDHQRLPAPMAASSVAPWFSRTTHCRWPTASAAPAPIGLSLQPSRPLRRGSAAAPTAPVLLNPAAPWIAPRCGRFPLPLASFACLHARLIALRAGRARLSMRQSSVAWAHRIVRQLRQRRRGSIDDHLATASATGYLRCTAGNLVARRGEICRMAPVTALPSRPQSEPPCASALLAQEPGDHAPGVVRSHYATTRFRRLTELTIAAAKAACRPPPNCTGDVQPALDGFAITRCTAIGPIMPSRTGPATAADSRPPSPQATAITERNERRTRQHGRMGRLTAPV